MPCVTVGQRGSECSKGQAVLVVAWLKQKSVSFRKVADGTPVIIVEDGHWHHDRMWAMRLQEQDVMSVARA